MKNIAVLLGDPSLKDPVKLDGVFQQEDVEVINVFKRALGMLQGYRFTYFDNHATMLDDISGFPSRFDYALNFCDEGLGNDPLKEADIPEALEINGVSYTGAGSKCLRLCYDKSEVRKRALTLNIPVARGIALSETDHIIGLPFEFPAIVKPAFADGSFGIDEKSVVHNYHSYVNQVLWLRNILRQADLKTNILVEEFLPGNEFTVAILGNDLSLDMRVLEEDFSRLPEGTHKMITHRAKWDPSYWNNITSKAPEIDKYLQEIAKTFSARMFQDLECRDYGRIDWKLDKYGMPRLLEANPNCGWVIDGHLAKAFMLGEKKEGSVECYATNVLKRILNVAEKRFGK